MLCFNRNFKNVATIYAICYWRNLSKITYYAHYDGSDETKVQYYRSSPVFQNSFCSFFASSCYEEIGELAKAIRKEKTTMSIDNNKIRNYDTVVMF